MAALTPRQAFDAMRDFLERHQRRTGSDDIASLLGDLQMLADDLTADPAAYSEWIDCVNAQHPRPGAQEAAE